MKIRFNLRILLTIVFLQENLHASPLPREHATHTHNKQRSQPQDNVASSKHPKPILVLLGLTSVGLVLLLYHRQQQRPQKTETTLPVPPQDPTDEKVTLRSNLAKTPSQAKPKPLTDAESANSQTNTTLPTQPKDPTDEKVTLLTNFVKTSLQARPKPVTYKEENTIEGWHANVNYAQKQALKDAWILNKLHQQGYTHHEEEKENKCLFFSILPQLSPTELDRLPTPWKEKATFQQWSYKPSFSKKRAQADFLRDLAMACEEAIVGYITANQNKINDDSLMQDFIAILYQDMSDELWQTHEALAPIASPEDRYQKLHTLVQTTPLAQKWQYCQTHFQAYKQRTSHYNSFAGAPEAFALSTLFGMDLAIYGNDFAASTTIPLDPDDNILPLYAKITGADKTILLLQTQLLGGHYQRLARPAND